MTRRPPSSTPTYTLCPYTTLFRSIAHEHRLDPLPVVQLVDRLRGLPAIGTDDVAVNDGAEPEFVSQCRPQIGRQIGQVAEALDRSEEHTSELQSLMRISYAVFFLKKKNNAIDKDPK